MTFLQYHIQIRDGRYISHEHYRCLIIKQMMVYLVDVIEVEIDGRTFWVRPVGSWVLDPET